MLHPESCISCLSFQQPEAYSVSHYKCSVPAAAPRRQVSQHPCLGIPNALETYRVPPSTLLIVPTFSALGEVGVGHGKEK